MTNEPNIKPREAASKLAEAWGARAAAPSGDGNGSSAASPAAPGSPAASPAAQSDPPSSEPADQKPSRSESRHKELADRVKTLELELQQRESKIRTLEQKTGDIELLAALKATPIPEDLSDEDRLAMIADRAAQHRQNQTLSPQTREELRLALLERHVRKSTPGMSEGQTEAVAQVLSAFDNGISVEEARAIAQVRHPDLFQVPVPEEPEVAAEPQPMVPRAFSQGQPPARMAHQTTAGRNLSEFEHLQQQVTGYRGNAPRELKAELLARRMLGGGPAR